MASIETMRFSKVYPCLIQKAERKGRTRAEVDQAAGWLLGYSAEEIDDALQSDMLYMDFFRQAPALNPERSKVGGRICGVRIEEIEDPVMQDIRRLDKMVDELAHGRPMQKVLREQS